MDNIHTETMMRSFPGLILNAMENGGMCFTDDGEYLDAADQPLDPNRCWIDFENGDGATGRIPDSADAYWTDEEIEVEEAREEYRLYTSEPGDPPAAGWMGKREFTLNGHKVAAVNGATELELLIAEQEEDDTYVTPNELISPECHEYVGDEMADEVDTHDTSWDDVAVGREKTAATRDQRDARERRNKRSKMVGFVKMCQPTTAFVEGYWYDMPVTKETKIDSHGWRGRKPFYKDRAARATGSGKSNNIPTHGFESV